MALCASPLATSRRPLAFPPSCFCPPQSLRLDRPPAGAPRELCPRSRAIVRLAAQDLVARTYSRRSEIIRLVGLSGVELGLRVPGEAFHLFQLASYLSWYMLFSSNYEPSGLVERSTLAALLRLALQGTYSHGSGTDFPGYGARPRSSFDSLPPALTFPTPSLGEPVEPAPSIYSRSIPQGFTGASPLLCVVKSTLPQFLFP